MLDRHPGQQNSRTPIENHCRVREREAHQKSDWSQIFRHYFCTNPAIRGYLPVNPSVCPRRPQLDLEAHKTKIYEWTSTTMRLQDYSVLNG